MTTSVDRGTTLSSRKTVVVSRAKTHNRSCANACEVHTRYAYDGVWRSVRLRLEPGRYVWSYNDRGRRRKGSHLLPNGTTLFTYDEEG